MPIKKKSLKERNTKVTQKYSLGEMQVALIQLNARANPTLAFCGALAGFLPAIVVYWVMVHMGGIYDEFLLIPPFIIGFTARYVGRCYKTKHRIPAATLGIIGHLIGCYLLELNLVYYILTPVAFAAVMITARTPLHEIHELALVQEDMGRLRNN